MIGDFRIAIIYPYFGPLPEIFKTWLMSVKENPEVDFIIYTDQYIDCSGYNHIKIVKMSFRDFCQKLQAAFDFPISIDHPYKICDFRPAFGDVFRNELNQYSHWGYGDIDLVFGSVSTFLTEPLLEQYDRISMYGHLSIYKNTAKMRELYRQSCSEQDEYRIVFSSPESFTFDEWWGQYGIEQICLANGINEYRELPLADVCRPYKKKELYLKFELGREKLDDEENRVFFWRKGHLYDVILKKRRIYDKREVIYAHFQKRVISCCELSEASEYWIVPNRLFKGSLSDVVSYLESSEYELLYRQEMENFVRFREKYPDAF